MVESLGWQHCCAQALCAIVWFHRHTRPGLQEGLDLHPLLLPSRFCWMKKPAPFFRDGAGPVSCKLLWPWVLFHINATGGHCSLLFHINATGGHCSLLFHINATGGHCSLLFHINATGGHCSLLFHINATGGHCSLEHQCSLHPTLQLHSSKRLHPVWNGHNSCNFLHWTRIEFPAANDAEFTSIHVTEIERQVMPRQIHLLR